MELSCLFEEVHQNGDIQQGFFLIKNEKLRYQYHSKNLYTIFYKDSSFFYVENMDRTKFYNIKKNTEVLEKLIEIIGDFPEIKDEYFFDNSYVKVENSKLNKFVKRITVISEEIKLSIYLNECQERPIKDLYFFWSPFWEYNFLK